MNTSTINVQLKTQTLTLPLQDSTVKIVEPTKDRAVANKPRTKKADDIGNCDGCIFYHLEDTDYAAARLTNNRFKFYCNMRKELVTYVPNHTINCAHKDNFNLKRKSK